MSKPIVRQQSALKPRLLPIREAERYSGLSKSCIYRLHKEGQLRILKNASRSLVLVEDLDRIIDSLPAATIR